MSVRFRITNLEETGRLNVRICHQSALSEPESLRTEFELEPGDSHLLTLHSDAVVVIQPIPRSR